MHPIRAWRRINGPGWRLAGWVIVTAVFAGGMWRVENTVHALADERHDRCVHGRQDTRSAIIRVVDELGTPTPAQRRKLVEVLEDELPSSAC